MVLTSTSRTSLHILQNLSLILLSLALTPLCTLIAVLSRLISPYLHTSKQISRTRKWRHDSSNTFRPRTILVTGVGMSKGLNLARTFYKAGHRVIGADLEPNFIPVCGHFSIAISKFYRLSKPTSGLGSARYIQDLKDIIAKEGVELWVPCSGIASGVEDGEAAEAIMKETRCKAVQFRLELTETLHEKHFFIDNTRNLGLNVPSTYLVTSELESMAVLYPEKARKDIHTDIDINKAIDINIATATQPLSAGKYIMKSILLDDSSRSNMTLLPLPTIHATESHIKSLNPTPFRPFVLQKFIAGPEYCTHSLILHGRVAAFVACPSSSLLMHYVPLPTSSLLSRAMLMYTTLYAQKTGNGMTGHFSIDFLVEEAVARQAEGRVGADVREEEVRDLMGRLYPIECNPRVHTAGVCLSDGAEDLAAKYLSLLPDHEPKGVTNGHKIEKMIVPRPGAARGYYWIGYDLVTLVLLPILGIVRFEVGAREVLRSWMEFVEHVLFWRDGTWEHWDPWPAWWLYVGYWPSMWMLCLWERRWWSRCNVSTNKMFVC
ncbi:hypothetical protein VTL71DRAFT_13805 [Oculimacula yallundae]|uniref:ATP-grasp domain-containing protein n=1 Tax=Oculimacula yallundae TaxID=86028 RepID=A0ABR4CLH1_9HELO